MSSTHWPQILNRTPQHVIVAQSLTQFYVPQLYELATDRVDTRTMQYRPYTRFAYAISMIPGGQGGNRSVSGIVLNEACQTCRDDLLVRNSLNVFAVHETCSRSFGWTRENIWEPVRVNTNAKEDIHAPHKECRPAFRGASIIWPFSDVFPLSRPFLSLWPSWHVLFHASCWALGFVPHIRHHCRRGRSLPSQNFAV